MASEEKKWREFQLRFNKRTFDWFVVTQPTIRTEDGYETRVIEVGAVEADQKLLGECLDVLGRSCAISCPECGASGYNQHAENCRYLILMRKLNARLGGERE